MTLILREDLRGPAELVFLPKADLFQNNPMHESSYEFRSGIPNP